MDPGILDFVGRTPVVRLQRAASPAGARVYVKLEAFSPTGATHDRLAKALRGAGFDSVAKIGAATDEALRAVNGIGPAALKEIRQAVPGSS